MNANDCAMDLRESAIAEHGHGASDFGFQHFERRAHTVGALECRQATLPQVDQGGGASVFDSPDIETTDHIDKVIAEWKQERPDYDLAPVEIIDRMGRIMEYVDQRLEPKPEEFGISRDTFGVLAALRRGGPPYKMTQRDLMQSLRRTSGGLRLRIDRLRKEGLVTQSQDQNDRRSLFVTLTPKGIKLLEEVIPGHLANEKAMLVGLTNYEREQLRTLLRKWLSSLEERSSDGPPRYYGMGLLDPRASLMKRRAVGLPDVPGILVHAVESGSPAEEMGFRRGDLICEIGRHKVRSLMELRKALNRNGSEKVRIVRGSESVDLSLKRQCAGSRSQGD
jgi:DNA-binding MarR family transcriptional regulator